jgi:transcription initiation factor TFIID subunit 1
VADEEPLISATALPKDEASDRFYKKGVEFAYSNIGGASSSSMDDDDYDEEPGATSSLAATADQSEAMAENSQSVDQGGEVVNTQITDLPETLLASEPPLKIDGATKQETAPLDGQSMESQDSGIGSQTPPGLVEESPLPLPSQPPGLTGTQQLPSHSEGDFPDLPDNMSLDELHAKVKKLFPGFKPNSILRFSSLLGPGKPSSLPKLWSEAKKPQKRKKSNKPLELKLDCDFIPPDHMINTDDEVVPVDLR